MKLAELQKNKSYFVYGREHWINAGYGESYYQVARDLRHNKFTPEFDSEGKVKRDYSGRVYMTNGNRTERFTLKQIRAEFYEAVALIAHTNRNKRNRYNDRGVRYAEHLKRKADRARREIEKPIEDAFLQALKQAGAEYVWRETKLVHLPIEVMQKITNALTNN